MQLSRQTFILFVLNFFDAVFTIYWVRNGYATEGNHLMAGLLDMGDIPFLTVKVFAGAGAAIILSHWAHLRIARYGLTLALAVYSGLMAIHLFTGLTVFGFISATTVNEMSVWTSSVFALIF